MIAHPMNELAAALAKAQGAMENATLNRVNPHFKSKYADLASIFDAVRKPLAENGLAVTQTIEGGMLKTRLLHSSGQFIESEYPLPQVARPQEMGSALTYARRYSLSAIVGISADDDDDANAAESAKHRAPPKPAPNVLLHNPAPTRPEAAGTPPPPEEPQPEPAAAVHPPRPSGGGLSLLEMARKAAEEGNAFFYGSFWDYRTTKEKQEIAKIKDELNEIMARADAEKSSAEKGA